MTRASTKRIADMVARVLSGTETEHDRTGEGMYAYARRLVGAWADRCATAEARLDALRGLALAACHARQVESGEANAMAALLAWLTETPASDDRLARGKLADEYARGWKAGHADAATRLAAYADLDVQHDSDCPAGCDLDGVARECVCEMRIADPGRAERDRLHCEHVATQIAGAGRSCSRCGEKIERYGGMTKRDGDGFRCGRGTCEERES